MASNFQHGLFLTTLIVSLAIGLAGPVSAQNIDAHQVYERACGGCHAPHAGDFASSKLTLKDGRVVGSKTERDILAFLEGGHGGVSQEEAEALVRQFAGILKTGRVFESKCRICHDRAVTFARLNLIVRNGRLYGRYSGRDTAEFLADHGRLEADEVEIVVDMFQRQLVR